MAGVVIVTKDATNTPVAAFVRVHDRQTGALVGQGITDAVTGTLTLSDITASSVYVVRFDCAVTYVPGDPYWSNVRLLLHMDGSNGSTVFTDEAGKTVVANGSVQVSTAQYKFGGAAGRFNGSGDYLYIASSADFAFGTADYTFEFWMRPSAVSYATWVFGLGTSETSGLELWFSSVGGLLLSYDNATLVTTSSGAIATNNWYHVAIVRSSGTTKLYINGVSAGSTTSSYNVLQYPLKIGIDAVNAHGYFSGYFDELRITKGVARYTADFTPPSSAFVHGTVLSLGAPSGNAQVFDYITPG